MTKVANADVGERNLKKLKAYHKRYGHFNVPSQWKKDKIFVQWLENIRKHPNRLSSKLRQELVAIGFDFTPASDWNTMFNRLKAFYHQHGHSYIPPFQKEYEELFDWTINQKRSKSFLTSKQVSNLESLQFDWEIQAGKDASWQSKYQELLKFKAEYGHTKVSEGYKENPDLARWVTLQRVNNTKKKLSPDRIKKLKAIGFLWTKDIERMREEAWQSRYNELVLYKKKHGHIDRLQVKKDHYQLGLWIETQMASKKLMSLERKKKLNAIDFCWHKGNIYEQRWNEMYQKLKLYKTLHGHCRVKKHEDFKLSVWLQRNKRDRNKIGSDKVKKLEQLGVKWSNQLFKELWEARYEELKRFKKQHGHIRVNKSNPQLYEWIQTQKTFRKENILNKERGAKLKQLGFIWNGEIEKQKTQQWETMYSKFKALKQKYGEKYHIRLKEQPQIERWVKRQIHNKHKLSAWKKKKLDQINFPWIRKGRYNLELWNRMYEHLKAYKSEHGNCDVPQKFKDKKLGSWVNGQRTKKLSPEQKAKLNALGFSWIGEFAEKKWHQRVEEFLELKRKNRVHTLKAETPLYSWLYQQKKNFHRQPAQKKKIILSLELNFKGDTLLGARGNERTNKLWEEKYKRLVAFKKRYGHCAVHQKWKEDKQLGQWVQFQRALYKKGTLLSDRIEKLNRLNFIWTKK
jgi:hypothetical protein